MKLKTIVLTILFLTINTALMANKNPFLQEYTTKYQAIPFNEIKIEHYSEALNAGLKQQQELIQAIIDNDETPNFNNTILSLNYEENSILSRVCNVLFNLNHADTNEQLDSLTQEYSPILTEASNKIFQNEKLFAKVKTIYDNKENLNLGTQDSMLLEKTYKAFQRCGATLSAEGKEDFKKIASEISQQTLQFGQNVLSETNAYTLNITDKEKLAGLPESALEAAAHRAELKQMQGWVFDLSMPSVISIMQYADNRELRKQINIEYGSRANKNNDKDNKQLIKNIINNRLAIAKLLGYKNHAAYKLSNVMAHNSENVYELLNDLLLKFKPTADKEVEELTQFAIKLTGDKNFKLEPWDFSYYAEKLKEQKFSVSDEELKPYFELENVKKAVFWLAGELYGLKFTLNNELPKYHKDVDIYEVHDSNGKFMALLYTDFHPRSTKQGGAWMTEYKGQWVNPKTGEDSRPIISIVMNFTSPTADKPALLTFSEVNTFLHEFGHALHGILSEVKYETISGTNVYRDFVELPSQIMENFASNNEFLKQAGKHYLTGEIIPTELVQKIKDSENFNVGYTCVRQLNFGFLDMAWHTIEEEFTGDIKEFETKATDKTAYFSSLPETCTSVAFNHIFSGGYSAGYYGYKWAEVLDADAYSMFKENGGIDKKAAASFRENILSKGGSEDPMTLYLHFRGQKATVDALLKRSGIK